MNNSLLDHKINELKDYLGNVLFPALKEFHNSNIEFLSNYRNQYHSWVEHISNKSKKADIFTSKAKLTEEKEYILQMKLVDCPRLT